MATKVINTILNMRDNMSKGLLATAKNMEKVDKGSVSATRSVLRFTNKAGKAVTDFAAKTVKRGAVALAGLATGFLALDNVTEEYRAAQERKRLQAAVLVKAEPEKPKKEKPRRPGGTKELEKQVAAAERAVAKAEERQYELTLKAEEVASNYLELQKVYDEQKALEEEIAALYTKWETLAAELEEARG